MRLIERLRDKGTIRTPENEAVPASYSLKICQDEPYPAAPPSNAQVRVFGSVRPDDAGLADRLMKEQREMVLEMPGGMSLRFFFRNSHGDIIGASPIRPATERPN